MLHLNSSSPPHTGKGLPQQDSDVCIPIFERRCGRTQAKYSMHCVPTPDTFDLSPQQVTQSIFLNLNHAYSLESADLYTLGNLAAHSLTQHLPYEVNVIRRHELVSPEIETEDYR